MAGRAKAERRGGRLFFWFAFLLVVAAIIATVLLANNRRNLDRLLQALPAIPGLTRIQGPATGLIKGDRTVRVMKGRRVPAATIVAPQKLFASLDAPEQSFLRAIRSDPRALCDRLKDGGFPDIAWSKSAAGGGSWECSSMLSIGAPADDGRVQSSVFVSVKGAGEDTVDSFRVKLNIERPEDRAEVSKTGAAAAAAFLRQVQWAGDGTVIERVQSLQEFDLKDFGSRIQLRKEFGSVPRYNFLASEAFSRHRRTGADRYFDRALWLAYNGSPRETTGVDPSVLPPRRVTTVRQKDIETTPLPPPEFRQPMPEEILERPDAVEPLPAEGDP